MNKYNHGTFVTLLNTEITKLIPNFERILLKINKCNMSKLFKQKCLNENMLA